MTSLYYDEHSEPGQDEIQTHHNKTDRQTCDGDQCSASFYINTKKQ